MNRTLNDATVRRYHDQTHEQTHEQLRTHLRSFLTAYNFAKRLKTLNGRTPFEFIAEQWASEPHRFNRQPTHHIPGPHTRMVASRGHALEPAPADAS